MIKHPDASSSLPWPPMIFAMAFVLAGLASRVHPLTIVLEANRDILHAFGIAIILAGGAIALAAEWSFRKAGTATLPTRPTSVIVPNGIYRYTRNPMYLGISIILAGMALFTNSYWFLIALPVVIVAVTKLAIEREEAYLERKFGADYLAYKARTRRWF